MNANDGDRHSECLAPRTQQCRYAWFDHLRVIATYLAIGVGW